MYLYPCVCVCHLTARRHGLSVQVAKTPGTVRALAEAAVAEVPVVVDARELDFDGGRYAGGVSHAELERFVTAEQVVEERELGHSTDDVEAHEDARRSAAFALASLAANKGPKYADIAPVTKIKGVVTALVWILSHAAADPDGLRLRDAQPLPLPPSLPQLLWPLPQPSPLRATLPGHTVCEPAPAPR